MRYEFSTAQRIIVGPDVSIELPDHAAVLGQRALLVVGSGTVSRGGATADLVARLEARGLLAACCIVAGEPQIADVEAGAQLARSAACDLVIGIGGGSVLDAAKAMAALAANSSAALEYLEVVGKGQPLEHAALPIIAVPTTAGTGSEVTRNAVISVATQHVKASIRHASMLPRLALVDATLTYDLPAHITASSGLDALTQLIEPYVSRRAQPVTDGICLEGLALATWALPRAYHVPGDTAAREAMSTASLFGGMALANAGLGLVHGIASPLGGMFPVPHGVACAALLPHVTAANIQALRQRDAGGPALPRYKRVAEVLIGNPAATADDLVIVLANLVLELRIPRLSSFGLSAGDISALAGQATKSSSTRANPLDLTQPEIEAVLHATL